MALALLRVFFEAGTHEAPLDEILAAIAASCSGTRVSREDFYSELRRVAEVSLPDSSPQRRAIIEDIDSAQKSAGRRKQLEIPMASGGSLKGYITSQVLSLTSDCQLERDATVKRILAALTSLGVVARVEIRDPKT